MTRKPTRLTHVNNATINRHDVLYLSEQSFATVHRVRLDLAYHAFSTDVKGFLLQNFQPRQCSLSRYRGFDSRGRTNTQGLKITEKEEPINWFLLRNEGTTFVLQAAKPSRGLDDHVKWRSPLQ